MSLTDTQIRSFKPSSKRQRFADGGGLFLEILPSGKKVFRLAYRFGGKQRTIVIGEYPETRLAAARLKAAEHKKSLHEGNDPKVLAEQSAREGIPEPKGPTWAEVANDYLMLRQRSGAAIRTLKKLDRQLQVTIKKLGDREVDQITPQDVLDVVNPIAEKGHVENAHEIRTRFSQVFRFAAARGLTKYDPAALTIDAMVPRIRGEFAGLTNPTEVGQLMRDISRFRDDSLWVGSALLLSAYLFPRNTELRGMRWDEIDWDRRIWEIPAERMKMRREHVVPLSSPALKILKELKAVSLGTQLVLPSPQNPNRMLSDNTFNAALRRMGYGNDRHVHHGFRTTASTTLNELGWNSDWIERQLAHVSVDKVRSSYNKAEYLLGCSNTQTMAVR